MNITESTKRNFISRAIDKLPINAFLTIPFVFLTLIAVVFISIMSTRSAYKTAAAITSNLLNEIASRAESRIGYLMSLPLLLNKINVEAYLSGHLNINNKYLRERYFYSLMSNFPDVPYVFIGTPKGQFYGAARRKDSFEIEHVRRDDTTNGESRYFRVNKDGTSGDMIRGFPGFDPRTRPWYRAAEYKKGPTWSPVYKHFVVPSLAVTASHPLYSPKGELIAVFAVDILLSRLNDFLAALEIGKSGWAFIIEPSGALVASSTSDALFYKDNEVFRRVNAKDSENPKIKTIAQYFLSRPQKDTLPSYIDIEGERFFTRFINFSDSLGLNWVIAIVIPERDFIEPLNQNIIENILICVFTLISCVFIAFIISKRVTHPIKEINRAAKELSRGNWDYKMNITRSDEIGELSNSFSAMASQLQRSLSSLETLVEIRTKDLKESNQRLEMEITERIKIEEALMEAKKAAEEANNAKSDFIATISHEIRTPMNGVIGMSALLLESPLTKEQKENVNAIISSGNALLAIINQVLDLSKIEAGVLEVSKEPFNLKELCRQVVDLLRAQAKKKGIYIEFIYSEHLPQCFMGDEGKIRQVLMNIVGNALKFTDKGGITISVHGEEDKEEDCYRVIVTIKDTGPGIAEEKQAHLFKRFSQINDKTKANLGGTGLGLSISKKLVQLMGGNIGISSRLGEGASFWFELPLKGCSEQRLATDAESLQGQCRRFYNVKALLVEDNPLNQKVAEGILNRLGCEVTVAVNGLEAIEMLQKGCYDIIFMDCLMPVMDGFEASRKIRDEMDNKAPIIALTANATERDRQRCLEAGMKDFITKPINLNDIYKILDKWINPKNAATVEAGLPSIRATEI